MAEIQRRIRRVRRRIARFPLRVFRDRLNPLEIYSDEEIFQRYRFRPNSIANIVEILSPELERDTNRSNPLTPLLCVLVTLHFLATGAHYVVIGDIHGVSASSVCRAVREAVVILARNGRRSVRLRRDSHLCKAEFYAIAGFPNVIGCIDCTHIPVNAPREFEGDYVNRKGYHSLNVQMVCDASFRIVNVVAKWPGSVHDARIFRESSLYQVCENGMSGGILLGDSGYPCRRYLLTPYLNPRSPAQERYNTALVRTRVTVEQAFGVIKRRFPCLTYGLRVQPQQCCNVIIACVYLHNFGLEHGDVMDRNAELEFQDSPQVAVEDNNNGLRYRDVFADRYFA